MLEEYATTRVRVGGQQADRRTGNLVYYAVEHPETRPVGRGQHARPRPAYPCRDRQPDLG